MNKQIKLWSIKLYKVLTEKEKELSYKRNKYDWFTEASKFRINNKVKSMLGVDKWTEECSKLNKELKEKDFSYILCSKKFDKYKSALNEEYKSFNGVRSVNSKDFTDKNTIAVGSNNLVRTLGLDLGTFTDKFLVVECGKTDLTVAEQVIKNGLIIDDKEYMFFTAGAGQTRKKKFMMIQKEVWEKHSKSLMCGLTIDDINNSDEFGMNISKFFAYLSLNNSSSEIWEGFDMNRCIVIDDFETLVNGNVDYITRNDKVENGTNKRGYKKYRVEWNVEPKKMDVPIPHGDGCGMILPDYCKYKNKNVQFRSPWIKGLMTPVDFKYYAENVAKNTKVKDIYGKNWDIVEDNIQVIFTKSQFKMWKYYKTNGENSWEVYKNYFNEYNCTANICKIDPEKYKDVQLNYQFLQTLTDMTDTQIKLLTKGFKDKVAKAHRHRESMLEFLEVDKDNNNMDYEQQIIALYPEILSSDYIIQELKDSITKAKNDTKGGAIVVPNTKRMFIIPDVVAWMDWIFKGKMATDYIPLGVLEDGQVFCKLYKGIDKLDILRSPHLSFEHAVKENISIPVKPIIERDKLIKKYMITNAIYTSSKDLISKILQFDVDGDEATVIGEEWIVELAEKMIEKYNIRPLYYEMGKAGAVQINKDNIYESLKFAWNGNIGKVSNALTKIWNSDTAWGNYNIIKKLCMYNNFVIDQAKTLESPKKAYDVQAKFKELSEGKYPYFLHFAKKEILARDCYKNDKKSVMNRICAEVDKIKKGVRYNFKSCGEFDVKKLMKKQRNFEIDRSIIDFYLELEKKTEKKIKNYYMNEEDDDITKSGYKAECYREARENVLEYAKENGFEYKFVIDNIIKYSFEEDSLKMKFVFEVFGAIIIQNINKNVKESLEKGYIMCVDCGKRVKNTNGKVKRCKECGAKANIEKTKANKKNKAS